MYLQTNFIETWDGWFINLFPSRTDTFYQLGKVDEIRLIRETRPEGLLSTYLFIHPLVIKHERYVYNFVMLSEDVGGILEVLLFSLSIFLVPIARFSFNLKATKELFYVRTASENLL